MPELYDYFWECKKCHHAFGTADQRCDSDEGWHNCCPYCRSANVERLFTVDGIDTVFETEKEAVAAAFDKIDGGGE